MGKATEYTRVDVDKLIPYVNNAKQHSDGQVTKIASSIREFGFLNPVLIDASYNVIAGHGRILAAKKLQMDEVPCLFVEGLTDAQRKAYILADNRLAELAEWDDELLQGEMAALDDEGFDLDLIGFYLSDDWFENRERDDKSREEGNDEYNEFLDKFETKKTTDDCYTPDGVYEAVASWVADEYKVERSKFIRPFYPGGDYQSEKYAGDAIVVDNPPFSILSEILRFYCERGIKFFLFAPTLTLFGSGRDCDVCYLPTAIGITYENGACVNTSFITNLDEAKVKGSPSLFERVQVAADEYRQSLHKELPKYSYPDELITAPMIGRYAKYGIPFEVKPSECARVSQLDAQKDMDKSIYGGGFLISEKAAAEKAAAHKFKLSERELEIVRSLGDR